MSQQQVFYSVQQIINYSLLQFQIKKYKHYDNVLSTLKLRAPSRKNRNKSFGHLLNLQYLERLKLGDSLFPCTVISKHRNKRLHFCSSSLSIKLYLNNYCHPFLK